MLHYEKLFSAAESGNRNDYKNSPKSYQEAISYWNKELMWNCYNFDLTERTEPEEGGDVGSIIEEKGLPKPKQIPSFEEFLNKYGSHWEFGTFAVVDEKGNWHEKGEMGWFGCSPDTREEKIDWEKSYVKAHLTNVDPETWLVVVDCHI